MVATETDILELKFDGNGIKPSVVRASEIAELIISFEKAIVSIIQEQHPEVKEDFLFISFEEISENSLHLKHLAKKLTPYVASAYLLIATAFENKNFNSIPNESIEELRTWSRFSKKYGCDGALLQNGKSIASFPSDIEIAYNDYGLIKGETTLYGEVTKAGGEKPRVTFKINGDYHISFEVKKEIAISLAANLYKEVGLKGIAKWDKKTFRVLDFKADSIVFFEKDKLENTFEELNKLFGKHLDGDNPSNFIN